MLSFVTEPAVAGIHATSAPDAAMPISHWLGRQAMIDLAAECRWVHVARRFVGRLCERWHLSGDVRDAATLVVSELTANAAQHGRSDMTVQLSLTGDALRITVTDQGDPPIRTRPGADSASDEHGRGLAIVEALASWVEVVQDERGRRVSASLHVASS
ncbi:ATP-binding protein [Streptomyces sp. NPDC004291]